MSLKVHEVDLANPGYTLCALSIKTYNLTTTLDISGVSCRDCITKQKRKEGGSMNGPQSYEKKVVSVSAMRFDGWRNADEIRTWLKEVFYVGKGYEHTLRESYEKDNSTDTVLDGAKEFLVLNINAKDVRVNVGHWLVWDGVNDVQVLTDSDFCKEYSPIR